MERGVPRAYSEGGLKALIELLREEIAVLRPGRRTPPGTTGRSSSVWPPPWRTCSIVPRRSALPRMTDARAAAFPALKSLLYGVEAESHGAAEGQLPGRGLPRARQSFAEAPRSLARGAGASAGPRGGTSARPSICEDPRTGRTYSRPEALAGLSSDQVVATRRPLRPPSLVRGARARSRSKARARQRVARVRGPTRGAGVGGDRALPTSSIGPPDPALRRRQVLGDLSEDRGRGPPRRGMDGQVGRRGAGRGTGQPPLRRAGRQVRRLEPCQQGRTAATSFSCSGRERCASRGDLETGAACRIEVRVRRLGPRRRPRA